MTAPDPETPLSDAEHRLGQVTRLGESFAMDQDETVRRCGRQVLAVLGYGRYTGPAVPLAAEAVPDTGGMAGREPESERRTEHG